MNRLAVNSLTRVIGLYQRTSVCRRASCRYTPTCSTYAAEAVQRFGAVRGSWLALRRLLRCHPWSSTGYDPVPELDEVRHHQSAVATEIASQAAGTVTR